MRLGHNFDDESDDIFHSHGFAKIAYGSNFGSASPVPGGGRAGTGGIGAVGTYRYADVSHRHKREAAYGRALQTDGTGPRRTLHVKERADGGEGAAFTRRDPSASAIRTFREPPGRTYNPYA